MKLKNTSKKIIHIGMNALLPDQDTNIPDALAKLPVIQCLVSKGVIALSDDKAPEEPADKAPETEDKPKASKRAKKETEGVPAE